MPEFPKEPETNGKPDKLPLWQKMYTRRHYMDMVRMVGYSGLSLPDAQEKTQELAARYGTRLLKAASDDLLQVNEQWVRLKTDVRKLAWQLLGPPPEYKPVDMVAEIMASGERLKGPAPDKKPKKQRKPRQKKPAEPKGTGTVPTPVMQHYRDAKERHPGMLLLFRMGDFYELYGEDAETASKLLGLTLTTRDRSVTMTGFPHHQLEAYLKKLLKEGQRVAVCDQVDTVAGPVRRDVERVVTPGSVVEGGD